MKMRTVALLAAAVLSTVAGPVQPEKYPSKPIRLISPFAPGGGTDILGRVIAVPVSEALGQPVVVDNRPGAGGAVGAEITARAEPDGYTIILVSSSYPATSAYRTPPYDPVNGIQPIILIGTTGLVMVVHPSVPARSVKELVEYGKANPRKLNYASVGAGSVVHLSLELFKLDTKSDFVHVPYKGGGPALNAVVGGEVQLTAISMVPTLPHVRAGRLRAIAITSPKRSELLPDVATIGETVPGFVVVHWYGMWGPKGMPRDIVTRWNSEVAKVLSTDQMKRQLQTEGLAPGGGPPDQLKEVLGEAVAKWRRVIREARLDTSG
ncbi:MAG TPA: tripartite tricarboxylate transporter substrate binding protein [Burkholderiales bacterium]|nr:tripartite tricarboxylate transporter substrate binding protein [Burkholderiales bacterium]